MEILVIAIVESQYKDAHILALTNLFAVVLVVRTDAVYRNKILLWSLAAACFVRSFPSNPSCRITHGATAYSLLCHRVSGVHNQLFIASSVFCYFKPGECLTLLRIWCIAPP